MTAPGAHGDLGSEQGLESRCPESPPRPPYFPGTSPTPFLLGFTLRLPPILPEIGLGGSRNLQGFAGRFLGTSPKAARGRPALGWEVLEPGVGAGGCLCRETYTSQLLLEG